MIRKTMRTVITFHTTTDAMAMEQICRENHADGRLIPVPGSISAGCGLAWSANSQNREMLVQLMMDRGIEYQEIHQCMV